MREASVPPIAPVPLLRPPPPPPPPPRPSDPAAATVNVATKAVAAAASAGTGRLPAPPAPCLAVVLGDGPTVVLRADATTCPKGQQQQQQQQAYLPTGDGACPPAGKGACCPPSSSAQGTLPKHATVHLSGLPKKEVGGYVTRHVWMYSAHTLLLFHTPQVAAFLTCIRHVSRVIWAEHLALAEGFEEDVVDLLKQRSVPYRGGSPRVWICVISVCQNGTSLLQTIHNGKI